MRNKLVLLVAIATVIVFSNSFGQGNQCIPLKGTTNDDPGYASGWIDLDSIIKLNVGDSIVVTVGGEARKILLRFLPVGGSSNRPDGLLPTPLTVPENRIVGYRIDRNTPNITQISVHGGEKPFGNKLDAGNGIATLIDVCAIRIHH